MADKTMYGEDGDLLLVALAILSLVASLGVTNMDYAGRARNMFLHYRKLQRLSTANEGLANQKTRRLTARDVEELSEQYQAILDETENHIPSDYLRHFSKDLKATDPFYTADEDLLKQARRAVRREWYVTAIPYSTLAVPVGLMVPLVAALFWY